MSFKLLSNKVVLKSRVFNVASQKWSGPEKSTFNRDVVVHPGAVAILPINRKGEIIMIRQFRPAAEDWLLEIPAGTLEKGETPLYCAKRELIEEIGFAARKWKKLGAIYTAPGFCTEKIHLFKAWDLKADFAEKDEDEHIRVVTMPVAKVRAMVKEGKINDAKSLSALACAGIL
ncbi:MAG TPA: NUDIX hydrolase [Planctomycetota bacterium]|nr:NUDIX hydrolase [Planctomycetota bacterium]